MKKVTTVLLACALLTACATSEPKIVQPTSNAKEIRLTSGLATQIELPDGEKAQSVIVGNTSMVTAETAGNVVNLTAKEGTGATNIIVRSQDDDGHNKTYQYRLTVQAP